MHLKIDEGFPSHPKTLRFGRLMQNPEAPWFLIRLWTWACRSAPDGDLSETEAYDIEQAINYRPLDGKCYRAMVDARFIDEDEKGRRIHNWKKRTGGDIVDMEAEADRKRQFRKHAQKKCRGLAGGCPHCRRDSSAGRPPDAPGDGVGRQSDKPTQTRQDKASPGKASPEEGGVARAHDPGASATDHESEGPGPASLRTDHPTRPDTPYKLRCLWERCWRDRYSAMWPGEADFDRMARAFLEDQLGRMPKADADVAVDGLENAVRAYLTLAEPSLVRNRHPFKFFRDRYASLVTGEPRTPATLTTRPRFDPAAQPR